MRLAKERGFTLVEILIVIFIISIVTSVALLTISKNENRQMELFAGELAQSVTLAAEQAMLQPAILGLSIYPSSYHFASYLPPVDGKKYQWVPLQDKLLGKHGIPDGMEVIVQVEAPQKAGKKKEDLKNAPQIIISTNGDMTPFKIYIGKKGKNPRYLIQGDVNGSVISKNLS